MTNALLADSSALPAPASRQIDSLTGLRALAAWHVVLFHVGGCFHPHLPIAVKHFLDDGESAVSLFFVLSGFVLSYVYLKDTKAGRVNLSTFYWARFSRIYPLYLLSVLIAAPVAVAVIGSVDDGFAVKVAKCVTAFLANASLVQAWHPRLVFTWNLPAWSLSAEAFFYVVFPWIAIAVCWLSRKKPAAIAVCLAVYLFSIALPPAIYAHVSSDYNVSAIAKFNPLVRLPEFVIGVVIGRLFIGSSDVKATIRKMAGWGAVALAMIIFGIKCAEPMFPFTHPNGGSLLCGLLIWALAYRAGPLDTALSAKPLVVLGEASYATYLLHVPLWTYWKQLPGLGAERPSITSTSGFLLALLAASLAAFYVVERPARDWLRRRPLLDQRTARA